MITVEEPRGSSTSEAHPMTNRFPGSKPTLHARGPNPFFTFVRSILLLRSRRRRRHERAFMERIASRTPFGTPRLLAVAGLVARDAGRGEVLPEDLFWAVLANAGPSSQGYLVLASTDPAALRARLERVAETSSRLDACEWSASYSDEVAMVLDGMRRERPPNGRMPAAVLKVLLRDPEACSATLRLAGLTRTAVLDWAERFSAFDA
jgi:hypothetical protein